MTVRIVKMYKLPDAGSLLAFFDVEFGGALLVRGWRILNGKRGLFVEAPREQGSDSRWYDVVKLKTPELQATITELAIAHYEGTALLGDC